MSIVIIGGSIATPQGIVTDHAAVVQDDRITLVGPTNSAEIQSALQQPTAEICDLQGKTLIPGLIDLHIHGAHGGSFEDLSAAQQSLTYLARRGVTSVMTSLASAPVDQMVQTAVGLTNLDGKNSSRVVGVHLEGPFIALDQCGAHDPQFLSAPTPTDIDLIAEHAGAIAMITLAPELPNAVTATARWAEAGIIVAAGHSSATAAHLLPCIEAGLSHATHLWSGMSNLVRRGPYRVPGLIDECLASSELTCEVIADGKHLPPTLLEMARRCVGERLIAVSDGTIGIGLAEGSRYRISTVDCVVDNGVGKVIGMDAFGGSTTDLTAMLGYLHRDLGWPLAEVIAMVTSRPAAIAGIEDQLGTIAPGFLADLVVLDSALAPTATMINGSWLT